MYLDKTTESRPIDTHAVFIALTKPHKAVTASTISRWIKDTLALSGIDTSIYKAHSTRSASTSRAVNAGVPIEQILKVGDWSNTHTFNKFYLRKTDDNSQITKANNIFVQNVLDMPSSPET